MYATTSKPETAKKAQAVQKTGDPMQEAVAPRFLGGSPPLQRLKTGETPSPTEDEDDQHQALQKKSADGVTAPAKGGGKRTEALPQYLRGSLQKMSGHDLSGVQVHYGSEKPAGVGAAAYAQGDNIHLAPGQERHLPHEAWHVVQQRDGRVGTTGTVAGRSLNDSPTLEAEATRRGEEAVANAAPDVGPAPIGPRAEAGSPASGPIQRADPITWTILGVALTASDIISIVGVTTAVASAVGALLTAQNGKSGNAGQLKLAFNTDYLMTPGARRNLKNVAHALFFEELELVASARPHNPDAQTEAEYKAEIKEIAKGNTQLKISQTLDRKSTAREREFVANGDGLRHKETPWGSARVALDGGWASPLDFSSTILSTAASKGITIEPTLMDLLKSCIIYFDHEFDLDVFSNDDIYVRGQGIDYVESDGEMRIVADVAFDWDGDTSYYRWAGDTAMSTSHIPSPTWGGPSDPDD